MFKVVDGKARHTSPVFTESHGATWASSLMETACTEVLERILASLIMFWDCEVSAPRESHI